MDDYPYWSKELIEELSKTDELFKWLLARKLEKMKIPKKEDEDNR